MRTQWSINISVWDPDTRGSTLFTTFSPTPPLSSVHFERRSLSRVVRHVRSVSPRRTSRVLGRDAHYDVVTRDHEEWRFLPRQVVHRISFSFVSFRYFYVSFSYRLKRPRRRGARVVHRYRTIRAGTRIQSAVSRSRPEHVFRQHRARTSARWPFGRH